MLAFSSEEKYRALIRWGLSPERVTRSVQNYLDHQIWCCEHGGVVHWMRPNIGPHAIGHVTLSLRTNHAVLFREKKPRWLRFPCGRGSFLLNTFQRDRPLHRSHNGNLIRRRLVYNGTTEALFGHPNEPIGIRFEMGSLRMRRCTIEDIRNRFTLIWRQRGYVHERLHPIIKSRSDYSTRIRVPYQDDRPILPLDYMSKSSGVICEGHERNGCRSDV